jgi:hypothetical protein
VSVEIVGRPTVKLIVEFSITEEEARALNALALYGDDQFIKAFYDKLGRTYMERHEEGLRSFLKGVRDKLPSLLRSADAARVAFDTKG